jgi:Mg-chelatase subunit ChlD
MAADDRIAALDAALDALVAATGLDPEAVPEEDLAMLRRLHDGWRTAVPDPAFVRRLGANLAALHGRAPVSTRPGSLSLVSGPVSPSFPAERRSAAWSPPRRIWRLPVAFAALAVCAVLVVSALVRGDDEQRETIPAGSVASPPAAGRAVVVVIDVSGSMSYDPLGGTTKLEFEQATARSVLAALTPNDWFGVLAFNDQQAWALPLAPLAGAEQRQVAEAAIDDLSASGGSELHPALLVAVDALQAAEPPEKFLVVLSDGKSRTGTPEQYRAAAQAAADGGIVISTVAIGSDADTTLMQSLAEIGGGRYHLVTGPEEVPDGVNVVLDLLPSMATPLATPAS